MRRCLPGIQRITRHASTQTTGSTRELLRKRAQDFSADLQKLEPDQLVSEPYKVRVQERFQKVASQRKPNEPRSQHKAEPNVNIQLREDFAQAESTTDSGEHLRLEPGDLVEYWPDNGRRSTCVIVDDVPIKQRFMTLSEGGLFNYTNQNRYRLVLKGFYKGELPLLKINNDPRFTPLRQALRAFKSEVHKVRDANRVKLASMHNLVKGLYASVDECANLIFETDNPTHVQLYCTFETMTLDRLHYLPDAALHMRLPRFTKRPADEVRMIENTQTWVNSRSREYNDFLAKARQVISEGQAITRDPGVPFSKKELSMRWSKTDLTIIDFLLNACTERRDTFETELYTTVVAQVVKDLELDGGQPVSRSVAHAALKKLGVVTPWDANVSRAPAMEVPGNSAAADRADRFVREYKVDRAGMKDRSASVRVDLEDMPVYTIDGEHAHELDDGLSFDGTNLYIHIADPAAYISHKSELGLAARQRFETLYLGGSNTLPMLPPQLTQEHFSLAARRQGTPSLTLRVGPKRKDGSRDTELFAATVRNVHQLTYKQVDQVVFRCSGPDPARFSVNWPAGLDVDDASPSRSLHTLTDEDCDRIRGMNTFLEEFRRERQENGSLDQPFVSLNASTYPAELPSITDRSTPTFFSGRVGITITREESIDSAATALVSEAAILYNAEVAKWGRRKKIPLIYRELSTSLTASDLATLSLLRDARGNIPDHALQPYLSKFETAKLRAHPAPAYVLGLPGGYTLASSPLRRYVDMITGWQVHAWLVSEEFPIDVVGELAWLTRRSRAHRSFNKAYAKVWPHQYLDALDNPQLTARIHNIETKRSQDPINVTLQPIGLRAILLRAGDAGIKGRSLVVGDECKVRVVDVDLMDNIATVVAV